MSALQDEMREAVRQALREELPRVLAELRQGVQPQAADLVGVEAAARRLGLRPGTIYKLAASIALPSHKIGGRLVFSHVDLDAYAAARRRSQERVAQLAAKSEE